MFNPFRMFCFALTVCRMARLLPTLKTSGSSMMISSPKRPSRPGDAAAKAAQTAAPAGKEQPVPEG